MQPHEVRDPAGERNFQAVIAAAVAAVVVGGVLLMWCAAQAAGVGHGSPVEWVRAWVDERSAWSTTASVLAVVAVVVLAAAAIAAAVRFRLWPRLRQWQRMRAVDSRARVMSSPADEQDLREEACSAFAARVGVPGDFAPGLPLGRSVATGKALAMNYEFTGLVIVGPRQGKTTSLCVPQIVTHAGPVVGCSNKRDLHDLTRGPRSVRGRVWVHDMQQIAQQPPSWFYDPLSFIRDGQDMASRAARLAGTWQSCYASPSASTDAYFGPGGETLLANLLLAAAIERLPVAVVLDYLGDLTGREASLPDPVEVLEGAGFEEMARLLASDRVLTSRQLDGLVGTARGIVSFLREPLFRPWITPDPARREFLPAEFVASTDTLLLLSKQERGMSGRAIVASLTLSVLDAGVKTAQRSSGGRLPAPMLAMLDEAANICPLPELPDLYSYLGSHGISVVTVLQNKAQGVKAWGADGMDQMTSSASVLLIGGGINETKHLRELADLIGQRQRVTTSATRGRKANSRNRQVQREDIFTAAELAAFPRGRMVAFSPGARPVLIRTVPWHDGPHATHIEASQAFYDPTDAKEGAA